MAQIIVRRLDDTVKERLRARAVANGRSLEAEAREILEAAANTHSSEAGRLGTRMARRFKGLGLAPGALQSAIDELRGEPIKPAKFKE